MSYMIYDICESDRCDKVYTLIYTYCNMSNLNTVEKREGRFTQVSH